MIGNKEKFSSSKDAIKAYEERFGYFPRMSFRGAAEQYIIRCVEKALSTGKEITAKRGVLY